MSLFDGIRHRWYVLRRGEEYAREIERELHFHLELAGLTGAGDERAALQAELVARRTVGNVTYYREEVRRVTPLQWLDRIRQDGAYAWRGLRRNPGFTATVVLTLGLGLGVNAAMYSFLDQLFVRPPAAVVQPDGVRRLYLESAELRRMSRGTTNGTFGSFNYQLFAALRKQLPKPDNFAVFTPSGASLITTGGAADSVRNSYVTPQYFRVLRLKPALGRFFAADEDGVETPTPVAVISDDLWHRVFGGDQAALGRTLELKGRRFTVVGVAPPDFSGIEINRVDVWLPLNTLAIETQNGKPWYTGGGNYLRAAVRVDRAEDETQLVNVGTAVVRHDMSESETLSKATMLTGPLLETAGPETRAAEASLSLRLAGVAVIVLLIACANITNVLLLRTASRRRELAVRRALGVSRSRLYAQLATESVLLAFLSGGTALLFAAWGGTALRRLLLPRIHWASPAVGMRVILATIFVACAIGVIAGAFPAMSASRDDVATALKSGERRTRYRRGRSQSLLLVTQAALSIVLLVGAGLFVRSLVNVLSIDIGYERSGLVVTNTYIRDDKRSHSIASELPSIADRIRSRPGVISVALSSTPPMGGYGFRRMFLPGQDSVMRVVGEAPAHQTVSPEFFEASGVRLVAGRSFTIADGAGSAPVMIVDEQVARALWPGESPLGKCIRVDKPTNGCTTVVGVAHTAHRSSIIERPMSQVYLPIAQVTGADPQSMIVRVASGQVAPTIAALRAELARIMPDQSDFAVRSMSEALDRDLRPWRMGAILFSTLGLLALVVAAIGIYGVVAYAIEPAYSRDGRPHRTRRANERHPRPRPRRWAARRRRRCA